MRAPLLLHTEIMHDDHDTVEPMTIDDLAILMVHGFNELKQDVLDTLRNEFNPRFDRLEARTYSLELKIDAVRSDISTLFFDGKKLKGRVENLEIQTFGSIQAM